MKHWREGYPWRMIQTNLRQIIDACHEEGIRVIARTDFSKVHYDLYEQHPEWAYRTAKGAWIAVFMVAFPVVSKLLDAITNVVMTRMLDTTTCRQGKLRPWFILSLPIIIVSVIMLFSIPVMDPVLQAIWVLISFNLFYSVG